MREFQFECRMPSFLLTDSATTNQTPKIISHDKNFGPGTSSVIEFLSFDVVCERCQALCSKLRANLQDELLGHAKSNNLRNSLIAQFPESHQLTISRLFVYDDVKLSTSLHSTERRSTVEIGRLTVCEPFVFIAADEFLL